MAKNLTPAEREVKAELAFELSVSGMTIREIGRKLCLNPTTVRRYLNQQREEVWSNLTNERREAALADYVAEQRRAMRLSMEMATRPGVGPSAAAMHMSNYMQASSNIAKARGVLTDKAQSDISVHVLIAQLDEAWTRPLPPESVPVLPDVVADWPGVEADPAIQDEPYKALDGREVMING